MKQEHRICRHTSNLEKIYNFYQKEFWLEIYNQWNRSEDDRWVIFIFGDMLIEYIYNKDADSWKWTYLYIEKPEIDTFYSECSVWNKTELVDTPWHHRQFSIFDPEWFEIKFFRDNNKNHD